MDILTTSLEALIQRATNNQNQCPDTAAIDAFCGLINQEPECAQMAARFIIAKVHSMQEWVALQALNVLDACMKRCGSSFHAEVGKFRFLNELIKLVSPKYLGAHTPEPVRRRVLELMQSWTVQYPKESKIKEAYEMLKKQGVVKEERIETIEIQRPADASAPSRTQSSIFQDEEKSRLLQKLLQSKKPGDLQAANRLIKTMVKEDERRVEQKVRRVTELEAVHNNARLLSEMLDSYKPGHSSAQDLELITELHTSCQRLRPTVFKLANEVHTEEEIFSEVLCANDELGEVFDKYTKVIVQGKSVDDTGGDSVAVVGVSGSSLLDLSTPSEELLPPPVMLLDDQLSGLGLGIASTNEATGLQQHHQPRTIQTAQLQSTGAPLHQPMGEKKSDFAALGDIFSSHPAPPSAYAALQPLAAMAPSPSLSKNGATGGCITIDPLNDRSSKMKALEDLDKLGAELLRENLPTTVKLSQFNKITNKVPMNQLNRLSDSQPTSPYHQPNPGTNSQLQSQLAQPDDKMLDLMIGGLVDTPDHQFSRMNGDSSIADLVDSPMLLSSSPSPAPPQEPQAPPPSVTTPVVEAKKPDEQPSKKDPQPVKPLGDLAVSLESIKPGNLPPRTLLEEKNGMTVVLHLSQSRPRPDVAVFVVTATSKNTSPLSDYLFQPVVPKSCRLRLQPPTATELPPHNPFLPPAIISQVMLIASSIQDPITLKFVVSYTIEEETITEMGEVENVPLSAT